MPPPLRYPDIPEDLYKRYEQPDELTFAQGDFNWDHIEYDLNIIRPIIKAIIDAGGTSYLAFWKSGDIKIVGRSGIESGWLLCDGSSYLNATYPTLFDSIGYMFGGSAGTFAVPDLRGRVPMGTGSALSITNRILGTKVGVETDFLPHSHTVLLSADGPVVIPSLVVSIDTILAQTDPTSRSLAIDPFTPGGTIDVSGLSTVDDVTGDTALSIIGDSSTLNPVFTGDPVPYTPAGGITLPTFDPGGIGTLNTNISGTVSGNTDDQSLSIVGSGSVPATHDACVRVVTDLGLTDVAPCADMHVDISAVAALLSIDPNPHNHSLSSLPLDLSQGLTGALDPPSFTGSPIFNGTPDNITASGSVAINVDDIAAALAIDPNPHNHTIPSLAIQGTASFIGNEVDPTGTVDVGGIIVSGTASGSSDETTISVSIPVMGETDIASPIYGLVQPSLVVNFIIKI